mgnify:CR=1 FL=1
MRGRSGTAERVFANGRFARPRKDLRGGAKKVARGDKRASRSLYADDFFFPLRGLLAHDRENNAVQNTMR